MTRITNQFLKTHFLSDTVEDVGGWKTIRDAVINARRVIGDPKRYPKADFEYLNTLDLEGTCFLLKAPVQFIV